MSRRYAVRDLENCLAFDGTGDYVQVAAGTLTPWTTQSTITFWTLVPANVTGDTPIIDSQWSDNSGGGWQLLFKPSQKFAALVGDKTERDTNSDVLGFPLGKWTHIAVTKNQTNTRQTVYFNGVQQTQKTDCTRGTTETDAGIVLRFGGNRIGGTEIRCFLSDIRVYNIELTIGQVEQDCFDNILQPGLIHRWKLNEGTGTTAGDSVGSAPGTITNATWNTHPPFGARRAV